MASRSDVRLQLYRRDRQERRALGDELSGSHRPATTDGSGRAGVARDRIVHGSLVVLVDAEGRIAERRTDLELDPDRLLASLRRLLG
jgi:cytochrome oxidase Cu insertion factor (SCO1/SenC/PrrC family)